MEPLATGEEARLARSATETAYGRVATGKPRLWCSWMPTCPGRCLTVMDRDDGRSAERLEPWLDHLVATVLAPGALAAGRPGFGGFTFDHDVSGIVVCRHPDGGMTELTVAAGRSRSRELQPPDPVSR